MRSKSDTYSTITDGESLATQLTNDCRFIAHDKHLTVGYHPEGVPDELAWKKEPTPAEHEAQQARIHSELRHDNYGILDISVLKFNLGYLNVKYLAPPEFAGESYTAAMNYLAKTDALIIDLRQCGGAISEHAIPFLCSYFFAQPTHLNDLYWRDGNTINQSWSYAQVPGHQYLDKPIYVLTSRQTFSGAEELAYDLKNLKRATLVGDTTGGGANPGGTHRINTHFEVFLPIGRAINPITHTNWEGVGVAPDSAVPARLALYKAQLLALRHIIADSTTDTNWRIDLSRQLRSLEQNPPVFVRHKFTLNGHPQAKQVAIAGSFTNGSPTPLARKGDSWVSTVDVEPGRLLYKFIVDGHWMLDPANPRSEGDGDSANSVLEIVH